VIFDCETVSCQLSRPIVYEYARPVDFLKDLLVYHKSKGPFSLRERTSHVGRCSQGLVSQILNGKRKLSRDHLDAMGLIFKLTQLEQTYIDRCLSAQNWKSSFQGIQHEKPQVRKTKNHILSNWLHPYVKDLVNLKGFSLEPETLFFMLQGMASTLRLKKSVDFLFEEGFWRRALDGKVVEEETAVTTTNDIPSEKIRGFHIKALELALKGIKAFSVSERKASTVIIAVDDHNVDELRGLLDSFQTQLLEFIEKHPQGRDRLMQVTMHLTPIGRSK